MYKVMICDDEVFIRNMLYLNFDWESHGIKVEFLEANGINGFARFCMTPVDIVITDIRMPSMSGIEMARKIRETDKRVEIIFLTSYDEFDYAKSAIEVGACGFVLKPIQNEYLKNTLDRAVANLQMKDGLTPDKVSDSETERDSLQITDEVNKYIEQNINRRLTLKEVAERFHYSPNYLGHVYREVTGMYFGDYVVKRKMEIAAKMLKVPQHQIGDIADALGYVNVPHFIRQFKSYWGITPNVYRRGSKLD